MSLILSYLSMTKTPTKLILHILLIFLILKDLPKTQAQDFSYDGHFGPEHWGEQFNSCDGKHQSPINIDVLKVTKRTFPPLVINGFDKQAVRASIQNNGHTVVVTLDFAEEPTLEGGPLNATYKLQQFHFHWGDNDTYGSEDRINNQSFPVELHMVFYKQIYLTYQNALTHADGVVVLAYFYSLSEEDNEKYNEFTSLLDQTVEPFSIAEFLNPPVMVELISSEPDHYYTYTGSLTTPPCNEVVTWIDFAVPIPMSSLQIQRFRNLKGPHGHLTHNFRPVQPLNDRIVYENIPQEIASGNEPVLFDDNDLESVTETIQPVTDEIEKEIKIKLASIKSNAMKIISSDNYLLIIVPFIYFYFNCL